VEKRWQLSWVEGLLAWDWLLESVLVALAISVISARVVEYVHHNRLRRATREALANELRGNLELLDRYETQLLAVATGRAEEWPLLQLTTSALNRALEPDVVALLSDTEQVRLALLEQHISQFQSMEKQIRESVLDEDLPPHPQIEEFLSDYRRAKATQVFLSLDLARTGGALAGAVIVVVTEQGEFVLSPSIEMASALEPLVSGATHSFAPVWRTSDLRRWPPPPGTVVAWRNDDPDAVPSSCTLIEIYAGEQSGFSVIDRENLGLVRGRWLWWRRRRIRQGIRRARARLARVHAGDSRSRARSE
jgi:hypothetical protein